TPFIGFQQDLVGDDIQLLLHFALHVLAARRAKHVAQSALADRMADGLAGTRNDFDQQAQFGGNVVVLALLFDQILGKTDAFHVFLFLRQIVTALAHAPASDFVITSFKSLDSLVLSATRLSAACILSRSAGAYLRQRSRLRARRAATCGLSASSARTCSAQNS